MPGFLVDLMLLRLGRWLRLMGQDVANPEESGSDIGLLQKAKTEKRTLITRDKRLADACRAAGVDCILIKASRLEEQLGEMAEFGIPLQLDPQRCTLCNGPLARGRLPGETDVAVRELREAILGGQPLEKDE